VFTRDLDLPRGPNRERVWFREHSVLLRGPESRALATTGAFRVVHADLRDSRGQACNPRSGDSPTPIAAVRSGSRRTASGVVWPWTPRG
jgi:hypothetical protein